MKMVHAKIPGLTVPSILNSLWRGVQWIIYIYTHIYMHVYRICHIHPAFELPILKGQLWRCNKAFFIHSPLASHIFGSPIYICWNLVKLLPAHPVYSTQERPTEVLLRGGSWSWKKVRLKRGKSSKIQNKQREIMRMLRERERGTEEWLRKD